jgi:preprotein translocase subunit YajC
MINALMLTGSGSTPGNDAGSMIITIIMLVAVFVVFYFFGIRPQKKQEKQQADMRNNLQVGDEITTIGGIIGKVVSIKDETCVIETSRERTKMRILKSAISRVDVKAEDSID